MIPLSRQKALQEAAMNHARYLSLNGDEADGNHLLNAHLESNNAPGYSGRTPGDRARHAGYPITQVSENVSLGENDSRASLDDLMKAIYHRLGFLDFAIDEVGIGIAKSDHKNTVYVYDMGNSRLARICSHTPQQALATRPIDCNGRRLDPGYMNRLCTHLPQEARFVPPYPYQCHNDTRLSADYMDQWCASPPKAAIHTGPGRYYRMCPQNLKIDKAWFDHFCANPPPSAVYHHSGEYYQICPRQVKVFAEWFDAFCASPPKEALYRDSGSYVLLCPDHIKVKASYLEALKKQLFKQNPVTVPWPPDRSKDIMPVFYDDEEDPDPLPDHSISGYPVSIQFNPAFVHRIDLLSFKLFREVTPSHGQDFTDARWQEVRNTRLLTSSSDPNRQFSQYQFALFALDRMQWNTAYKAVVEARVNGKPQKIRWVFKTQELGLPLYVIEDRDALLPVKPGVEYALYLPPSSNRPTTITSLKYQTSPQVRVHIKAIDGNTLKIRVDGSLCNTVDFQIPGDGGFKIRLATADNTQTQHPPQVLYGPCPENHKR
jgi:hypothetical protein